jgi:hypothetical protein
MTDKEWEAYQQSVVPQWEKQYRMQMEGLFAQAATPLAQAICLQQTKPSSWKKNRKPIRFLSDYMAWFNNTPQWMINTLRHNPL